MKSVEILDKSVEKKSCEVWRNVSFSDSSKERLSGFKLSSQQEEQAEYSPVCSLDSQCCRKDGGQMP